MKGCSRSCCRTISQDRLTDELAKPAPHLRRSRLLRPHPPFSARMKLRACEGIANAAAQARVPTVVTNDVLYHCPSRRMLQDVVTCIRLHTTIDNAGFQKERHADRFLKAPAEMLRLFPKYEAAVRRTWEIAERCTLLARSADLHLSDRRAGGRPQCAGAPGKADLGRRGASAIRKACPITSRPNCGTNSI